MLLTGIEDNKAAPQLSTFPNPSASSFSVTLANGTSEVEIFNMNGQLVYTAIPESTILNVEKHLPAGLYFVKAIVNGTNSFVKHLVK
jgi:hypothetical protein